MVVNLKRLVFSTYVVNLEQVSFSIVVNMKRLVFSIVVNLNRLVFSIVVNLNWLPVLFSTVSW